MVREKNLMAIAVFENIDEAIKVLVMHHNKNINGRFLKISFGKVGS